MAHSHKGSCGSKHCATTGICRTKYHRQQRGQHSKIYGSAHKQTNKQFVWLNAASIRLMRAAISWLKTHNQIVANLTQTPLLAHILQHIRNTLPTQLPPKIPQSAITQKKTAKLKRHKQQTINNPPTKIAIKTKKRKITVSVKIFLTAMWPTMVRERTIRTPQSHHDGQ